jgi:proteasome accessory factor B
MAGKGEHTHAGRILRLRQLLNDQAFLTVGRLMDEFGVCRKTVYNDIAALEEAGVPIERDKGPSGEVRFLLSRQAKKFNLSLGQGQVLPFGMALRALSFLEGTEVHDQIEEVMGLLCAGAHSVTKKHLGELSKKVAIVPHGPRRYRRKAEVMEAILGGLMRDQLVRIRYRRPDGKLTTHVVEPLTLLLYREALYLIANSRTSKTARTRFAVDRITSATWLKGEDFDYPEDYDPAQVLDGAFGLTSGDTENVEILFEPDQARYVMERDWHPTQKFKKLPDGRVRMTMTVSGTQDVLLWLVGHTGTFEVVSPPRLRDDVKARLEAAKKAHRKAAEGASS